MNTGPTLWSNLKKIGRSKIVSLTIFMPIFGYMIMFNEHLIGFFELSSQAFTDSVNAVQGENSKEPITIDTKTRLYYFYFGFSFIGVASLIYQMFCPSMIKEYESGGEYIQEQKPLLTENRLINLSENLEKEGVIDSAKIKSVRASYEIGWQLGEKEGKNKRDAAVIDLLDLHWESENTSDKAARLLVFLFYMFGFFILAIPSYMMFKNVLEAFVS